MALSKPLFFTYLKTLNPKPHYYSLSPSFISIRLLSFATPEEAAAERRRRKRRLRIEPPLNALRHHQQPQRRPQNPIPTSNPNAPKLPDSFGVLTGNRLKLHQRILTLIRENDLEEAALYSRHSIYSNCKPTVFTCNAVLAALLRQSKYSEFLSFHRFITQASVVPNVVTYNLLFTAYCDCKRIDSALDHYKLLINNAPFNPSPTTYRILVKGLVDNARLDRALEIKDEMLAKGLLPDPIVYNHLMLGLVKSGDSDGVLDLYNEMKEKVGFVSDGVVYGSLMKGYFQKGMEKEAMDCYNEAVGEDSKVRMSAVAYNWVLDALNKNGMFDEAKRLFDRMMEEHNPPGRMSVNLGSFNVMVNGYCAQGRLTDAIGFFKRMGEKNCSPDTLSYNYLIEQLCGNEMMAEAEELFKEMGEDMISSPDEFTYMLLVNTCLEKNRVDEASKYFAKMAETSTLRPNAFSFNKIIDALIESGKIDEAKGWFDQMVEKLKTEVASYESMLRVLCEAGKLDEALKMVGDMLMNDDLGLSSEIKEVVTDALRREGREEDLPRVIEEKEREKAEILAKKEAEEIAKNSLADNKRVNSLPSMKFSELLGKGTKDEALEVGEVNKSVSAEVLAESEAETLEVREVVPESFSAEVDVTANNIPEVIDEVGEVVNESVSAEVLANESEAEILEAREVVTETFTAEADVIANNIPEVIDGNVLVDEIQGTKTGTVE
ncbi:hypothetical protein GIB67_042229 [Kingdonia uniflora]|uniref:Pentatricopeptide repeat-containing protein n=1 Tax=Kingdonia uniflora TaxID=39325 RepID=A0A7J7LDT2_9MAGN|nr:hypothetical protein GIB67_042229 [Kingdonia uniflora]